MPKDLLHECTVSQTPRLIWIPFKLQAATDCPSVTPVAKRKEETEDQKICVRDSQFGLSTSFITQQMHIARHTQFQDSHLLFLQ